MQALSLGGRIEQAMTRAGEVAVAARRASEPTLFAEAALAVASPWVPLGADARQAQLMINEALDWLPRDQAALRVRLIEGLCAREWPAMPPCWAAWATWSRS